MPVIRKQCLTEQPFTFLSFRTMIGIQEDVLNMFPTFLFFFRLEAWFLHSPYCCVWGWTRKWGKMPGDGFLVVRREEFNSSLCMLSNQGREQDFLGDSRTWSNKGRNWEYNSILCFDLDFCIFYIICIGYTGTSGLGWDWYFLLFNYWYCLGLGKDLKKRCLRRIIRSE